MRISKLVAVAALIGGLTFSFSAWAPPGGNNKGGKGGDNTNLRMCAEFNGSVEPYITKDDRGLRYCDGTDGEILLGEGLKLSTTTRNTEDRKVNVSFAGANCDLDKDRIGDTLWTNEEGESNEQVMDAFFGWQKTEYVESSAGCADDPFSGTFSVDSLNCLKPNDDGDPLVIQDLPEGETRFMSWRVHLTDADTNFKKSGRALLMAFSGALGPDSCPVPAGLPIAVQCVPGGFANGSCNTWRVKAFRACVYDYDTSKGGNWRKWADNCPINTDITFVINE